MQEPFCTNGLNQAGETQRNASADYSNCPYPSGYKRLRKRFLWEVLPGLDKVAEREKKQQYFVYCQHGKDVDKQPFFSQVQRPEPSQVTA